MDRRKFLKTASVAACSTAVPVAIPALADRLAGKRANIVVIITDEQSADAMSCRIGQQYLHTPNMDRLVKEGVSFTRAYCANPICVPSRTSMFTGRYPTETGVVDNDGLSKLPFNSKAFPFMGKIFASAGYETAYFGKWHLPCIEDQASVHGFSTMATTFNDDIATTLAASEYIKEKRSAPFLMVASYLNPHNICEWARDQKLPLGAIGNPPPANQCPPLPANHLPQRNEPDIMVKMRVAYHNAPMFPVGKFDDDKWRQYKWAYYRLIENVDQQIGALLDSLRDAGVEEDTLVVFVSDHGDCQGAHGWNQKTVFYEESVRVPFVILQKGVTRPGESTRLVNTGVDLIPTLCGYAGVPIPASLPGENLRTSALDQRKYVVVSNHLIQGGPVDGHQLTPSGRMVRSQRYKYCVYSEGEHRESLVDLQEDPGEMINVADSPAMRDVLNDHRLMLAAWSEKTHDTFRLVSRT